ncbi:MAG: trypsin-like serine protease [Lachnospiraceae bacterium]|nr:trypsin-like serine protease [Lachnospiraceae bacterium]
MYENNYPNNYNGANAESGSEASQSGSNAYYYEQPKPGAQKPKKQSGTGKKLVLGICCGLLFGIFAGLGFEAVTTASGVVKESLLKESGEAQNELSESDGTESSPADEIASTFQDWDGTNLVQTTVTDVTEVVKAVMPSVVSVNNKYVETTSFWGQEFSSEGSSTGSGIIVGKNDTELLVVTNYHVVEAAEELSVQFADGKQVQAQMKGSDSDKDLAVIAVQLNDMESSTMSAIAIAQMGDSTQLTVGEPVIAIGNALGYGQSVTTGVVSALNRPIAVNTVSAQSQPQQDDMEVNTFIQTDAAINPGNSGGALLNSRGQVIGINSNKIGGSAVEGMGYAIPISDAQPIIEDLMTKQTRLRVEEENRGFLGITGIDVVSEYSQLYGMPKGVYISSVSEGTGAAAAGLIRGDIITALNGEEIKSMDDLKDELSYYSAGTTVELTIMQGSPTGYQAKNVSVTLGEAVSTQ